MSTHEHAKEVMKRSVLAITLLVVMVSCKDFSKDSMSDHKAESETEASVVEPTVSQADKDSMMQMVTKIPLKEEDLFRDYDGGSQLADFFQIELIDKKTFLKNRSGSSDPISRDSSLVKKQNGLLVLPCTNGDVRLADNLAEGDTHKEYSFIGQLDLLNAYLISGIYWEDWNYFFVDRTTGRTLQTFSNYPYLSADAKYIISIDVDTFEGAAYIDLFEVTDKQYIDPLVGMYIKSWVPIDKPYKMYWGKDNYLYIPVVNNRNYWEAEGNYAGLEQYIRLKQK